MLTGARKTECPRSPPRRSITRSRPAGWYCIATRHSAAVAAFLGALAWVTVLAPGSATAQAPQLYNPATEPLAPCDYRAADIPGQQFRLIKDEDRLHSDPALVVAVAQELAHVLQAVKDTFPGQKGFEAEYFRAMPKAANPSYEQYQLSATLVAYQCHREFDRAAHGYVTTDVIRKPNLDSYVDTGVKAMTIRVSVNRSTNFLERTLLMPIDGAPHTVLLTFDYLESWGSYSLYGGESQSGRKITYIARNGEQPFVKLTERQYVTGLLAYYDQQFGTTERPGIATPHTYVREDVEWERRDMQRFLQETPSSTLEQPARPNAPLGHWGTVKSGASVTRAPLEPQGRGGQEILVINHAYFRKETPPHVPQFIVLEFAQPSVSETSRILYQRFHDNFPGDRLRALLDH